MEHLLRKLFPEAYTFWEVHVEKRGIRYGDHLPQSSQVANQVDPVNEAVRDAFGFQDDNFTTEVEGEKLVFFWNDAARDFFNLMDESDCPLYQGIVFTPVTKFGAESLDTMRPANLAKAYETISIQIRAFESSSGPYQHVMDQILACTSKQNLLLEVDQQESSSGKLKPKPKPEPKSKAVLVTSLSSGQRGNHISVKAWAEMYLLSLTDVLVTSAWSTFGYVAQGLRGLKPLIMFKHENRRVPNPPCGRVISMEPHMSWGLKLVDIHDDI
ncbi:hypothetical protein K1719_017601 [Acacia pycnantha]|nr:hypothetical protein K1719_017601 [Acacia pycnantha]